MDKFKQLETFVTIIEQGSFAAAADKLHLTSPALSKQMKSLEAALALPLIKRTTRHLKLTPAGEIYFEKAKALLANLREAETLMMSTRKTPQGILKVMANHHFSHKLLLPSLPDFLKRYPKINLKLDIAERFPDFIEEDIDILFAVSANDYPNMAKKVMGQTRYVFCASAAYIKKFGLPKTPQALKQHRYLAHSMRERPQFVSFKGHDDVYVNPYLWLNDSNALRECALRGLGIAKLHAYFVDEDIKRGKLIELYKSHATLEQPLYLYYPKNRYLDPKIKAFIDFYA